MKKRCRRFTFLLFLLSICRTALSADSGNVAPVYVPNGQVPRAEALKAPENSDGQPTLPTVTVRGFLNFRTTVDGTVIVFTPASENSPPTTEKPVLTSRPSLRANTIQDTGEGSDIQDLAYTRSPALIKNAELDNSVQESFGHLNAVLHSADNVIPTRTQDNVATSRFHNSETIKVTHRPTPSLPQYPTGLVTVLGGTHVENGATTVFETKVIGTYIDGKYAQILQSTSRVIGGSTTDVPVLITKPSYPSTRSKPTPTPVLRKEESTTRYTSTYTPRYTTKSQQHRPPDRRRDEVTSNSFIRSSFKTPETTRQRSTYPTQSLDSVHTKQIGSISRRFRPTNTQPLDDDNTVYTHRPPPNGRLRFVLPRRNTQTVRLNRFKVKLTVRQDPDLHDQEEDNTTGDIPYDIEGDPLISVDPARVVYQRTTITSEVTLHVGRRKSVRTLTIITTVPKTVHPSAYVSNGLQELAPAQNAVGATVLSENETPPVVVSRTYTTTERTWRTSLLPVLDGESTTFHTVTESFFILKIITAYKTMPPGEVTMPIGDIEAVPTLDAGFNAQTALLNGAVPLPPSPQQQLLQTPLPNTPLLQGSGIEKSYLPLGSNSGTLPLNLANPLLSLGAALHQNPLAAVYLGLQQLNNQVTLYSTVTKTQTYVTTDTVYSTKVVSFYDGRRTRSRTLSESLSTTERTITNYTTTVQPYLNTQAFQQQQQLQQLIATHLPPPLPPPPRYTTLTSTYTTVTTATSYSTKVYSLTYNAFSTKFRTVTSSSVYMTTITTTSTTEIPVQPTAPPGGYPYFG